jgi:hypothetical protein
VTPDTEPYGKRYELGEEERFDESKRWVACGVTCGMKGQDQEGCESRDGGNPHRPSAVVGGGERFGTLCWELVNDSCSKVDGNAWLGGGFEGADDPLVEMLGCGLRRILVV